MENGISQHPNNQLLIQHISNAAILTDAVFTITAFNAAAENLFGYKEHEVAGKNIALLIPFNTNHPNLLSVKSTGFTQGIVEQVTRDSRRVYVHASLHPITPADASISFLILYQLVEDNRRKIAAAHYAPDTSLQKSEEKYRLLIEQALDGIYIINHNGWFLYVNARGCEMSGYTMEELLQLNFIDIVPPEQRARELNNFYSLRNGPLLYYDGQLMRKDGSIMYIELSAQYTSDGQIMAIAHDITQRRIAETALQQSEERHRMLFLNSPLPIFVMDLENLHFLDVNDAAINTYGYTKEEFLNMTALDIRPPEDYDKFHNKTRVIKQGLVDMGLFKHVKKDGSIIDVEIYTHNFLYDERNSRLVLALDVTEKLKAQRELLNTTNQLRKLSDHLQNIREVERTRISREIHDELGQQLTILKMDISWLHQKLKYYKNPDLLQRTEDTVKLLNDTIITVRRIATELRPSLLDDLGLVAALEWQSKEFENRSGIKIAFTSSVNNLVIENTVATSLFRIYQEALTNVARHAHAHNVFSNLIVNDQELTLTIKDDGQGFDMATIDNKKTLGLLGMRERALMMGGNFTLQSTIGNGTTITVQTTL